jgi:hypothetical protein
VARVKDDHPCYHLRARTRKAVEASRREYGVSAFERPMKVTVTYRDAFDLVVQCLQEGSAPWEADRSDRFGWSDGDITITEPEEDCS